ncbi:MAG: hypothetical protein GY805_16175 [Chloroflexi bacterium]|nr:hypothetical protein [Chloroflexota bacterium]
MKDVLNYSATVLRQNNHSLELASLLPLIIGCKLENVAARKVTINGSIVSFHGRASRLAPRRKRFVTNWNLLHMIVRGAIQVKNNFPEVSVSYWLGFPKSLFYQFAIWLTIMGTTAGIFYFFVQSSVGVSLLLALSIVIGGFLLFLFVFTLSFIITIIRFNLFIKHCINAAEKQVKRNLDLTLTS